jgi:high-affinity iron transporter
VIDGVTLPYWLGTWFGVYATWESFVAQVAAAVFVVGTYYIAEAQQKHQREEKAEYQPKGISQHNSAGK